MLQTIPTNREPVCASNESTHCSDIVVAAAGVWVVRNRVPVLSDVSLNILAGETIAILGPNGAGKSTLLKCLAGVIRPDRGEFRWFDRLPQCNSSIRRQIGFLGHEHGLYGELTARENLVFAGRMYGVKQPSEQADSALEAASLTQVANKRVVQLSHGLRQRVAVVRAAIHNPRLVLLDEPCASLDVQGRAWLDTRFDEWRHAGTSVCFVSHDFNHSNALADRVVTLEGGRIVNVETAKRRHTLSQRSA